MKEEHKQHKMPLDFSDSESNNNSVSSQELSPVVKHKGSLNQVTADHLRRNKIIVFPNERIYNMQELP